jgi:hypothetical protein
MRRAALILFAQVLCAAPMAAQFEGTVSMTVSGTGAGEVSMKMAIQGDRQATIMTLPMSAGPMAGMEMRVVLDPKTNIATSLIPVPPALSQFPGLANAKGIRTEIDLAKVASDAGADHSATIKKLGTSQRIAGLVCDDYEITPSKGTSVTACVTESLGHFVFPQFGGGMGGGASAVPAWASAFGDKPSFPLKVRSADGTIAVDVTSVEKGRVDASLFEIPEGYVDMATLFRGRGGH